MSMDEVTIYTDGACSGNPGQGGWGAVLFYLGHKKEISGYSASSTNNIMELTAAIEALKLLKKKCNIQLFTDSKYLIDGITGWIFNWERNNWRTASKQPVKNKELWQELQSLTALHQIKWNWVKGHSDNEFNERCDQLARKAIKNQGIVQIILKL